MKKALTIAIEDQDLIELMRILMDEDAEANWFASAILLPKDKLVNVCKELDIQQIDAIQIERLARVFLVSPTIMEMRLKHLHEYGVWSGPKIVLGEANNEGKIEKPDRRRLVNIINTWLENKELPPLIDAKKKEMFVHSTKVGRAFTNKRRYHFRAYSEKLILVIEFSGTPNSGKDSSIYDLEYFLTHHYGLTVKVIEEAVRDRPYPKVDDALRLQHSIYITMINLLEATNKLSVYDVVLVNRGVFDLTAWVRFYCNQGVISEEKAKLLDSIICQEEFVELEDLVILCFADPRTSTDREKVEAEQRDERINRRKATLSELHNSNYVNVSSLEALNQAYDEARSDHAEDFEFRIIDTNKIEADETSEIVLDYCESLVQESEKEPYWDK